MKRGILGVYHHASPKHLGRYVDEFAFRLNEGNVKLHTLTRLNSFVVLLRQEIGRSDVTVRATLREHFLGETGHERGPAGTVYGLRRGAGGGDRACRSGGAVA